jgi:hypothetical protein
MILVWLLDLKFLSECAAKMEELQIRHTSAENEFLRLTGAISWDR